MNILRYCYFNQTIVVEDGRDRNLFDEGTSLISPPSAFAQASVLAMSFLSFSSFVAPPDRVSDAILLVFLLLLEGLWISISLFLD